MEAVKGGTFVVVPQCYMLVCPCAHNFQQYCHLTNRKQVDVIHFYPQPTSSDSGELFRMKSFVLIDG